MKKLYFFGRNITWRTRFQKVCRQLQQLINSSQAISSKKIQVLIKHRNRYAKRLLLQPSIICKAGSTLLVASTLSITAQSQNCKTYIPADSANPIRRAGLPQNLWQPTFVDIDGDGDLDCYETNTNAGFPYNSTNRLQITFLRNTGTRQLPYYVQDPATGFPSGLDIRIPEYQNITRLQFADIDGDGDYDCFVAGYYKYLGYEVPVRYYKNTGTAARPKFINTPAENPFANFDFLNYLSYALADLDQDGDIDLVAADISSAKVYRNTGTKTSAKFTPFVNLNGLSSPEFFAYDYNKDGRNDVFNGSNGDDGVTYYRNTGGSNQLKFVVDKKNAPQIVIDEFTTYTFADLNGDGVAEAFSIKGNYAVPTPVATVTKQPKLPCDDLGCDPDYVPTLLASPSGSSYTYQWYAGNQPIAGATNSSYQTDVYGSYSVAIKNSCGTGLSLPFILNADNYNSKQAIPLAGLHNNAGSVMIYPNPFTDHFVLNLGNDYSANTIIKITDLQGRVISIIKANGCTMQIGSSLRKGIYIVQVIQNNVSVLTQKMIKQ